MVLTACRACDDSDFALVRLDKRLWGDCWVDGSMELGSRHPGGGRVKGGRCFVDGACYLDDVCIPLLEDLLQKPIWGPVCPHCSQESSTSFKAGRGGLGEGEVTPPRVFRKGQPVRGRYKPRLSWLGLVQPRPPERPASRPWRCDSPSIRGYVRSVITLSHSGWHTYGRSCVYTHNHQPSLSDDPPFAKRRREPQTKSFREQHIFSILLRSHVATIGLVVTCAAPISPSTEDFRVCVSSTAGQYCLKSCLG